MGNGYLARVSSNRLLINGLVTCNSVGTGIGFASCSVTLRWSSDMLTVGWVGGLTKHNHTAECVCVAIAEYEYSKNCKQQLVPFSFLSILSFTETSSDPSQ